MTCSINFNRRGKKIEVLYIPDEEIDYYYEDEPKPPSRFVGSAGDLRILKKGNEVEK